METVTRTIYGAHLSTCKMLNKPFTVLPNSTLNSKFNVLPTSVPGNGQYPSIGYIGIGNKGATYTMDANNYVMVNPVPHSPRDASLFNFIPFIVRPSTNDLTPTQRAAYRLRVPITVGTVNYIAYYLKAIDMASITPTVELRNVNNGVITTNTFSPASADLSPISHTLNNNINTANGDYLVSTASVNVILTQADINEIINACQIILGNPNYAVINEIAICSGLDTNVTTPIAYTESIATQVVAFISQYHTLTANTSQIDINLDIGSVEPLLVN